MRLGDIAPELVLLGGGVVVLLYALAAPRRLQAGASVLATVVLAAAAVRTTTMLDVEETLTFADTYAVDGPALWAKLIILGTALLTVALSTRWFASDPRRGELYAILVFSTLGAVLLAGATDLMQLILAVLLASVTAYVLAAYHRRSKMAGEAALKYYLLGALTNGGMLYGTALLFGLAGTTTLVGLAQNVEPATGWVAATAFALVALGLSFKVGSFPAHPWVPDVAEGAPAPMAAFLTVVGKVGALVALARLASVLPADTVGWRPLLALLAAVSMTLGNLAALTQEDVRRLLGWSSVSQAGYALMALVALQRSELAVPALLYFLLAYALANLAAFGVVVRLRGLTTRSDYRGLARRRPLLAGALALSFLSFIGIPPLAGFAGKLALFAATIEAGYTWLAVLAAANTVVSVGYYARVLAPMYFDEASGDFPAWDAVAGWATAIAVIGFVVAGLGAEAVLDALVGLPLLPR